VDAARIAANLGEVKRRLAVAAASAGRSADEIQIIAISKTFPVDSILLAAAAGQLQFGENRVQEAEAKIPALRGLSPGLEWHLVGHLQTNKARLAAGLFDVVHSLDSLRLAARLNEARGPSGRALSVLLQIDLGHGPTKYGAGLEEIREILAAAPDLTKLRIDGLMTLPPFFEDPEGARPYFSALRRMRDNLEAERPGCLGSRHLSMGMSHDFEVAVQEGATMVRIGTAIFGSRSHG
jgi:hypothetical protein